MFPKSFRFLHHEVRALVLVGATLERGSLSINPDRRSVAPGPFRWPSLIQTVRSFLTLSWNAHCSPACDPANVIAFTQAARFFGVLVHADAKNIRTFYNLLCLIEMLRSQGCSSPPSKCEVSAALRLHCDAAINTSWMNTIM